MTTYLHTYHAAAAENVSKTLIGANLHGRFYVDDGFGNLVRVADAAADFAVESMFSNAH